MKRFAAAWLSILLLCSIPPRAKADAETVANPPAEPLPITLTLPEAAADFAARLTDGLVESRVSLADGETVSAQFGAPAQGLYIQWFSFTTDSVMRYSRHQAEQPYPVSERAVKVTQLDAADAVLSESTVPLTYLNTYLPLSGACRTVTLTAVGSLSVSELTVYEADAPLNDAVQRWEPTVDAADLLIVAAEPGAELSEFGGLLPQYAVENGVKTTVMYMTTLDSRLRAEEGLAGLWAMGLSNYPVFAGFHTRNSELISIVEEDWAAETTAQYLAALIDRLQPTVIVTHGAWGLPTRAVTSACVLSAIELAAHQVQKVYLSAERDADGKPTDAAATAPDFDQPLLRFHGATANEAAQGCYLRHASRQLYARTIDTEAAFTLARSAVGTDVKRNDLFEHLDIAALYAPPPPTATPAPTPLPTPAAETQAASDAMVTDARGVAAFSAKTLLIACGVALTLLLLFLLRRYTQRLWVVLLGFAPALIGTALYFLLGGTLLLWAGEPLPDAPLHTPMGQQLAAADGTEPAETAAPDAMAAPLPSDTPVPAASATPAPAVSASPYEAVNRFRTEGEPGEVVLVDTENGQWVYRSDLLGIQITRVSATVRDKPIVYFAADILIKDIHQYRSSFGSDAHTGTGTTLPWIMARRSKAVLWLTGDNLINDDKEFKGTLIRDGRIYYDAETEDCLAICPDMSLRVYPKWDHDATDILESGVNDTYSFGPTLVTDGIANPDANDHRVKNANPRVGIGMYEPGHYLAIVVDGRQRRYSVGLFLDEFAELFASYGVDMAYNLDGGLSAAMVFMGEQLNSHSGEHYGEHYQISYQRSVPDGLMFGYSNLVPSETDPILNDGNKE